MPLPLCTASERYVQFVFSCEASSSREMSFLRYSRSSDMSFCKVSHREGACLL